MKPEEKGMDARHKRSDVPDGPAEETAEQQSTRGKDDACRCKEVSEMPPRKLFGLMLSDLAFWKKAKKA